MAKMWLLIGLLLLASAGCTRRDWVSDMLVLVDVTGEWNGTVEWEGPRNFSWTLQQSGGASHGRVIRVHDRVTGRAVDWKAHG
jgi:hypothetical protein